ncbi:MAG: hypothetical protein NVS3B5_11860 [Sphingomicrobium sp.]
MIVREMSGYHKGRLALTSAARPSLGWKGLCKPRELRNAPEGELTKVRSAGTVKPAEHSLRRSEVCADQLTYGPSLCH